MNVDGAFNPSTKRAAIDVIARNAHGLMVYGCAYQLSGSHTADSAEACAFKEGVLMAVSNGWRQVMFEGDAISIVSKLANRELDRSVASSHLASTVVALGDHIGFSFGYVKRAFNRVTHGLAQYAINENINFRFDFETPTCIKHIVIEDAIFGG
ncbi:hypothetical protein V6N13_072642 [Hibiscus sabdariffa]